MSEPIYLKNLSAVILQLRQARKHLQISYQRCQKIGPQGPHSEDDLIEFEALTGRFSRVVDLLIHKLFRAIDTVELVDTGTLIDVMNRAEKRRFVEFSLELRALKDLRNEMAHEYLTEKLIRLQEEVYESIPKLFAIIENSMVYSQKYLSSN
jgi:hypothetical protein